MIPSTLPRGAYRPLNDLWLPSWGDLRNALAKLPQGSLVVIDAEVARLHPRLVPLLEKRKPIALLSIAAGERAKSLKSLAKVLAAGAGLPRTGTLLSIGGGTLGDLCTVAAHLLKRGVSLIHMPTTLLAAVDSSVGGKGAIHVELDGSKVKNGAGVFHYPEECWLFPELFLTLSARQVLEGEIEAWKMAVCLDRAEWKRLTSSTRAGRPRLISSQVELLFHARELKASICARDPYELTGMRAVLNFGHTLGHAIESLTRFRIRHGEAVALGALCALDLGTALGHTPAALRDDVERGFVEKLGAPDRANLAKVLKPHDLSAALPLLAADKKVERRGALRFVLLTELARAEVLEVPERALASLWPKWRTGKKP